MLLHQAGRARDQSHNDFLLYFNISPPFYSSPLLLLSLAAQGEQLSHLHLHPPLPLPPYLTFSSSLRFKWFPWTLAHLLFTVHSNDSYIQILRN